MAWHSRYIPVAAIDVDAVIAAFSQQFAAGLLKVAS